MQLQSIPSPTTMKMQWRQLELPKINPFPSLRMKEFCWAQEEGARDESGTKETPLPAQEESEVRWYCSYRKALQTGNAMATVHEQEEEEKVEEEEEVMEEEKSSVGKPALAVVVEQARGWVPVFRRAQPGGEFGQLHRSPLEQNPL